MTLRDKPIAANITRVIFMAKNLLFSKENVFFSKTITHNATRTWWNHQNFNEIEPGICSGWSLEVALIWNFLEDFESWAKLGYLLKNIQKCQCGGMSR